MLALLLILPAASSAFPHNQCRLIDNIPFFNSPARSANQQQEIELLTEFARFAQGRVPQMLADFARYKQIINSDAARILRAVRPRKGRARFFGGRSVTQASTDPTTTEPATTEAGTTIAGTTIAAGTTEATTTEAAMTAVSTTEAVTTEDSTANQPATTTMGTDEDDEEEEEDDESDDDEDDEEDKVEESIEDAINNIVEAVKETLNRFKEEPLSIKTIQSIGSGVLNGLKSIFEDLGIDIPDELPDVPDLPDIDLPDIDLPDLPDPPTLGDFSLSNWPTLCKVVWWPHQDEHCNSMRCAACSPAMFAAAKVCKRTEGQVEHFCLRRVLGDGACGFCSVDYLQY